MDRTGESQANRPLRRIIHSRSGLLYSDSCRATERFVLDYCATHELPLNTVHQSPPRAKTPYTPLSPQHIPALTETHILDFTGVSPLDDPFLLQEAPKWANQVIVILPARIAEWLPPKTDGMILTSSVTLTPLFAVSAEKALGSPQVPIDNDGPILRRLVLEARTALSQNRSLETDMRYPTGEKATSDTIANVTAQTTTTLDEDALRSELVVRLLRLGEYEQLYGHTQRAFDAIVEAKTMACDIARLGNATAMALHRAAALCDALGDIASRMDHTGVADAAYRESAMLSRRLQAIDTSAMATDDITVRLSRAAADHSHTGEVETAIATLEKALKHTSDIEYEVAIRLRLASMFIGQLDLPRATSVLERTTQILQSFLALEPRRFDMMAQLVAGRLMLSHVRRLTCALPEADVYLSQAAPLLEQMLAREPTRSDWHRLTVDALLAEAEQRQAAGDPQRAVHGLSLAADILKQCADRDPSNYGIVVYQHRLERRRALLLNQPISEHVFAAQSQYVRRRPKSPSRALELCMSHIANAVIAERHANMSTARHHWTLARRIIDAHQSPVINAVSQRIMQAFERLGCL